MSRFKLIAIDMDGTLLNNDLEISPRVEEAIRRVRERDIHVTLCTGRMYASALPYARKMGLDLPLVTYNGAYVKHSGTGEILYNRNLPVEHAREVFLKAKSYGFHVNVYYQDRLYVEQLTERGKIYARTVRVPIHVVDDMLEFLREDPIKIVVLAEPGQLKDLEGELGAEFGDKLYITKSSSTFLEILHPEATKGRGLQAVARYLNVPRESIMGIGDSFNDLEMFKYAGFAVVMENAEPEIKSFADYITCCNDDDGVAEALEKLVLV
ncbi:Cof-type HAD-IIB family hydrolase [Zhaonella formicivorans]|jgi:hypothetical protein|uniref:Cof-type HAD-IIB family hydrolase n=1 Tax=Zhaonella formicivorans TaxID=2528593 RepID=UPI0010F2BD24|nr:Cof-type HAD-IIB family hydrolase [Zhaonella formicivorans]